MKRRPPPVMLNGVPAKACSRCGETKPLTLFKADKRESDGKSATCLACHWQPKFKGKTITCAACGKEVPHRGHGHQIYCIDCGKTRELARKAAWAREHPTEPYVERERSRRTNEGARIAGATLALGERQPIAWDATTPPDLVWEMRIAVPFRYEMSKNRMLGWAKKQKPHLTKEFKTIRDQIRDTFALKMRAPGAPRVAQAKLWVDILVQKPDNRGDAVNVIDLVCDALKVGIGLDDRWFAIRRLDWQIVKSDPRIYIGIGQETEIDHQACSSCGRVLPLDAFPKGSSTAHMARGRNCRECLREGRKLAKSWRASEPT